MRRLLALLTLLLVLVPAGAAGAAAKARTTLGDVEDEVMCVQCGTPLYLSQAPSADRERALIKRLIAQGRSKAQIKAELVREYGRNVLATPPDRGFDVTNWLVPVILALVAIGAVATTARRWRRAGAVAEDADGDDALDAEDARRLERDMASYDL